MTTDLIVYLVRHQVSGIVPGPVFSSRPTPEQVDEVKRREDLRHGRIGWAIAVPVPLVLAPEHGDLADRFDRKPDSSPPAEGAPGTGVVPPQIEIRAVGTVTPPAPAED